MTYGSWLPSEKEEWVKVYWKRQDKAWRKRKEQKNKAKVDLPLEGDKIIEARMMKKENVSKIYEEDKGKRGNEWELKKACRVIGNDYS